jgi:hypothetical protein
VLVISSHYPAGDANGSPGLRVVPDRELVAEGASIVILGRFNPAIISPAWLLMKGLLGEHEAMNVSEQMIVPRLSVFTASWLRCETSDDRFSVTAEDPLKYQPLRDVAVGVLDALPETPVSALGMNRYFHFRYADITTWHGIGDSLAPKEKWDDALHLPGMRSLTMEGARPDGYLGYVWVKIEPSNFINPGVFVEYNDHYFLQESPRRIVTRDDFSDPAVADAIKGTTPSGERVPLARKLIVSEWESTLARAESSTNLVMDRAGD